jgi:hypothetical protein
MRAYPTRIDAVSIRIGRISIIKLEQALSIKRYKNKEMNV